MRIRLIREGNRPAKCGCQSALRHWINNSGQDGEPDCTTVQHGAKKAFIGFEVQKIGVGDDNVYIIPVSTDYLGQCGQEVEVKDDTIFVTPDRTDNCGKI